MEFLTLITLTQLSPKTFWIDVVSKRFKITTCLTPTVNRIWLCLGQRSCLLARSVIVIYLICFALSAPVISVTKKFYLADLKEKESSCRLNKPLVRKAIHQTALYALQNVLKSGRCYSILSQ